MACIYKVLPHTAILHTKEFSLVGKNVLDLFPCFPLQYSIRHHKVLQRHHILCVRELSFIEPAVKASHLEKEIFIGEVFISCKYN